MQHILIYKDFGADPLCVSCVVESLCQAAFDRTYSIRFADHHLLKDSAWMQHTALLIFPGGRDIPYHRALQGAANQNIINFVQAGGSYFGICAGGYYGCAKIEFEKGFPLEVVEKRELKFFPGIARGSAYGGGKFCYRTGKGSRIASLMLPSKIDSAAYFKGGCVFVDAQDYKNVEILASYHDIPDMPAAAVLCKVGLGQAVLSGVHPEYSFAYSGVEKQMCKQLGSELKSIENKRFNLFVHFIAKALTGAPSPSN